MHTQDFVCIHRNADSMVENIVEGQYQEIYTEMPAARLINICPKLTKGRLTPHQIKISRLHTDYESPAKNYVNLAASLQTSHYPILMDCPPQYRANKTWEAQLVKKITSSHNCEVISV